MRVVSIVCAAARKCHARWPKKFRCSTTEVSIRAAFTAYFENSTRYWRFSPGRNGTGTEAGAAGAGGVLTRGLERFFVCWAAPQDAQARMAASSIVAEPNHLSFEDVRSIVSIRRWQVGSPVSH